MNNIDYCAIYDAIIRLSFDIESEPIEDISKETALKLSYIKSMFECLEDVPMRRVRYAESKGINLPEID